MILCQEASGHKVTVMVKGQMKLKRIKDLLPEYCIEIPTTALVILVKGPIHKYGNNRKTG